MVNNFSETLTETCQPMSWQQFQHLADQLKYKQARFYYKNGYMKGAVEKSERLKFCQP